MKKTLSIIICLTLISSNSYGEAVTMSTKLLTTKQVAIKGAATAAKGAAGESTFLKKAKAECSAHPFMCVVAALSAAQLVATLIEGSKSNKVSDQTSCVGGFCTDSSGSLSSGNLDANAETYAASEVDPQLAPLLEQANTALKELKEKGYVPHSDGSVTTPEGTMSPGQIASAMENLPAAEKAALEQIKQEALKAAEAYAYDGNSETGGGKKKSSGSRSDETGGSGFDINAYLRSLNSSGEKRGVAGLSVKAGSDNVGVRESNIFEQISAAYKNDTLLNRNIPSGN